ncbi:orotidine-5'-phosphate decarboxylase [Patescibacteria group bacterium]
MQAKDRIIVALDVDSCEKAESLVEELKDYVGLFKVGLELATSVGALRAVELVRSLGAKVFLDLKFKDIPNTIFGASRAAALMDAAMFNIHVDGGAQMMRQAKAGANSARGPDNRPLVLGVTVLTSLSKEDLTQVGLNMIQCQVVDVVVQRAVLAKECGLDGVVASPKEVAFIRAACGPEFKLVIPGIRPEWAQAQDQKRVMTPAEAIKAGADYLVIGRPITQPPAKIGSPVEAAKQIVKSIEQES